MKIRRYNESDLGFDPENINFDYTNFLNKIEVYEFGVSDMDTMIQDVYGKEYSSWDDEQERIYEANIRYVVKNDVTWSQDTITEWLNSSKETEDKYIRYIHVDQLLNRLCHDGLIPPGIYYMGDNT